MHGAWIAGIFLAALFVAQPAAAAPARPAVEEPRQYSLGNQVIALSGPEAHRWVNKDAMLSLKLAPSRYENPIKHVIAIYAREPGLSLTRPFHNYGALFFVGPKERTWTEGEFAELKRLLMPGSASADPDEQERRHEYLRQFLERGIGLKLTPGKARKYYERAQRAVVLRDTPQGVALALLHEKKGEKNKLVTLSLSLIQGRLVGTLYYQVDPGQTAAARARRQTLDWQNALLNAGAFSP